MTDEELTPKEVGGFRILRRLASGATSDVLLARAEGPHGFQRVVALKILLARRQGNPEFEQQFAAEASAYARLTSPAVVKLYDFFSADGQLVMVLEFVDGLPLHKLRAMLAIAGERVDDKAALYLGMRVFSALAAAHGARDPATGAFAPVVHYDVNPSNILVPWDGQVKLGDFGIARAAGIETDARAGFIKGTYGYSAPEQVSGKEVSLRADIYSAGLILWELLARRKAVQRGNLNDAQVLRAMAHPEFPALELLRPDLAAPVRTAVRRTLEPDADKRTITADEVVAILRAAFVVDDGRSALSTALMRVRSAGEGDPLASTTPLTADAARSVQMKANAEVAGEAPLDPEQTAPFAAVGDDSGDLGNIAFRGHIKLPNSVPPQDRGLPATSGAFTPPVLTPVSPLGPPPVPPPEPTEPSAPPPRDEGATPLPPVALPRISPPTLLEFPPRAPPRPVGDKKISTFPTVPAPALASEPPPAASAPPGPLEPTAAPPGLEIPAAAVVPAPEASAPGGPPRTERSPETADLPTEPKARGSRSSPPASQAQQPPYVQSELPPRAPSRLLWLGAGAVGLMLAGGAAYLVHGDTDAPVSQPTASTSVAPVATTAKPPSSALVAAPLTNAAPPAASPPEVMASPSVSATPPVPSSSAPPPPPPPPSAPAASTPPSPTPTAAPVALAGDTGEIELPGSAAGHRVFVDGKVAQEGAAPLRIHCGSHVVKVGSAGAERKLDVPCGGTVTF